MAFIRIKTIGKNGRKYRYAYLVVNKWKKGASVGKKGSRQKVSEYLGKVISFDKTADTSFSQYYSVVDFEDYLKRSKKEIIRDLVKFELSKIGFIEDNNKMIRNKIVYDLDRNSFSNISGQKLKIVIEMNEGFLCENTINAITNTRYDEKDVHKAGVELAKRFLEAGLDITKEVFIGYYSKL